MKFKPKEFRYPFIPICSQKHFEPEIVQQSKAFTIIEVIVEHILVL